MAKKGKGFFNEALLKQKRRRTRVDLVGSDGVNYQDERARKAGPENAGKEATKRVGEYQRGKVDKVIDKVKRYKNPGNK